MKNRKLCIYFFIFFLWGYFSPIHLSAQTYTMGREEYMPWEEFVSEYFEEMEDERLDMNRAPQQEDFLELLEDLHRNPININLANKDDLMLIPFLSETQADSILSYREKKRLFRSLGELQWISGIPYVTRCRLSLFTYAGDTLTKTEPLRPRFYQGKHEIVSRLDIPLYRRAGDKSYSKAKMQSNPNKAYLGNRLASTTRYRYRWRQDIAYGLTFQKDSGEPFAAKNNYPFDYNAFYFYFRPEHHKYAVWLGDYNLHFGQGLLFGHSFFNSPLQSIENGSFPKSRIRPHTSSDEINYFRGAAGTIQLSKHSRLSAFASCRQLDGRVSGDTVTSFKTDGLHRTQREIDRRKVLNNTLVGTHYAHGWERGHIGATLYWSIYNKMIYPDLHDYNRFYLRGKSAGGFSTDYAWRSRKWKFYGETGGDKDFNFATTNTFSYAFNSNVSALIQERSFSTRFVSPFGNTLQEGSHTQNEHGLLFGTIFQPFNKTRITAYAEYFYHPCPTFRTDLASHGVQVFLQTQYAASKRWAFVLRYKMKTKEQNVSGYKNFMQYVGTHRTRLNSIYTGPRLNMNIAGDFTAVTRQTGNTTFGWMLSTRNRIKVSPKFAIHSFASIFFTDDYAARLYAYEPQLQYAASFPTFAYHGMRLAGLLQWKFYKKAYVGVRYGWLHYFNRNHISSGIQEIASPSKNDLSLQMGWTF